MFKKNLPKERRNQMANITAKLLTIGSVDISNISSYEVQYNKLWKDADRNMNGDVRATLIGIFPKIVVKTTVQEQSLASTLGNLLNQPYFNVSFYDVLTNTVKTAQYYASDFTTKLKLRQGALIDEMSFSLVPVSKRA